MSPAPQTRLPAVTRAAFTRELRAWSLLAVALGALEGGVAGVIVKSLYAGTVPRTPLNFAMALVSGAGMFANLLGLAWTAKAEGRNKVRLSFQLQLGMAGALLMIAFAPLGALGLVLFVAATLAGRIFWAGAVAVRSVIWRANYPREARSRIAGTFITWQAVLVALGALGFAAALGRDVRAFRWLYLVAAAAGICGALVYRRLRVQGHESLIRAEQREIEKRSMRDRGAILGTFLHIMRTDRAYAGYLTGMFVFGGGNIMLIAPLIATFADNLHLVQRDQVLILTAIPMLTMPLAMPRWARLLDRLHIIDYRKFHAWSFVVASASLSAGAIAHQPLLLWLGAALWGVATAGGELGWNLGHNDFAPGEQAAHYMGLHMTLTGLRGFIAPLLGIAVYQGLESRAPGMGPWSLLVPLFFTTTGAIGFSVLSRSGAAAQARLNR